jgi:hypothetical protein
MTATSPLFNELTRIKSLLSFRYYQIHDEEDTVKSRAKRLIDEVQKIKDNANIMSEKKMFKNEDNPFEVMSELMRGVTLDVRVMLNLTTIMLDSGSFNVDNTIYTTLTLMVVNKMISESWLDKLNRDHMRSFKAWIMSSVQGIMNVGQAITSIRGIIQMAIEDDEQSKRVSEK